MNVKMLQYMLFIVSKKYTIVMRIITLNISKIDLILLGLVNLSYEDLFKLSKISFWRFIKL